LFFLQPGIFKAEEVGFGEGGEDSHQ
jgi:hypothetical protein